MNESPAWDWYDLVADLRPLHLERGYLPLEAIVDRVARLFLTEREQEALIQRLCAAFNHAPQARDRIRQDANAGQSDARLLSLWMQAKGLRETAFRPMPAVRAAALHTQVERNPKAFLNDFSGPYPVSAGPHHWGMDTQSIKNRIEQSRPRLASFTRERTGDTAVLVGNGPSLANTDWSLLKGQDVYVTNYALEHAPLRQLARGVAVSNYFVAAQAPELFGAFPGWQAYPAWLSAVVPDTPKTLWVPALGGPLFFAKDPFDAIAWHSTVSYFWMQILFHAGYRKLVMIGFDNSYHQPKTAKEGDLLRQSEPDPNHFDPRYFQGKIWQAADPDRMAQTYRMAKTMFETAGRRIVNATAGGQLDVFDRQDLAAALTDPA